MAKIPAIRNYELCPCGLSYKQWAIRFEGETKASIFEGSRPEALAWADAQLIARQGGKRQPNTRNAAAKPAAKRPASRLTQHEIAGLANIGAAVVGGKLVLNEARMAELAELDRRMGLASSERTCVDNGSTLTLGVLSPGRAAPAKQKATPQPASPAVQRPRLQASYRSSRAAELDRQMGINNGAQSGAVRQVGNRLILGASKFE